MGFSESFAKYVTYPAWDLKDGSDRLREFKRLSQSQWLPLAELQRLQLQRLNEALTYAYRHCAFYRQHWGQHWKDGARLEKLEDIRSLPILSKADVRASGEAILTDAIPRGELIEARTGGSTGKALVLKFDVHCQEHRNAAAMRSDYWAGWRPGMWTAALWGSPHLPSTLKEKLRNQLLDRLFFLDTVRLNETTMREFIQEMNRRGARAVFGHAHSLYLLAHFALDQGLAVNPVKAVISTSMMLLDNERVIIEKAFGCKVGNRYGCEEVGLIAAECEQHHGLHVNAEHTFVELLRPDGQPAAPGEEGDIVVTDLVNRGMPLIRYRIEDVGVASSRVCACGRQLPIMEKVVGRVADFLVRRDGSLVQGVSLVEKTLTAVDGVEQLQIVQESLDVLALNLVAGPGYGPASREQLIAAMREQFGDVTMRIEDLSRIPQEPNGKYRFAICKVSHGASWASR